MKAVRVRKPEGLEGIEGLVYEDAPDPQPAIGDALVQVRAASFTPTELTWPLRTDRAGHERALVIPAHEGSGVVVALGYGTAGVSVGDEVYGLIDGYRDGWAAEYVIIEARSLAPKPTTLDFIQAAEKFFALGSHGLCLHLLFQRQQGTVPVQYARLHAPIKEGG